MMDRTEPTGTDLALVDAPFTYKTLQAIISTSFVPRGLRGDTMAALACILYGRELGLGPMQSMRYVDVIDGRPSPTGEFMVARIFDAGHIITTTEQTDQSCTVEGKRIVDGVTVAVESFTFTTVMADRAGLLGKSNWKKYPEAMLYWRAVAQLARQFFSDVIGGLSHLAEELGDEDWHEEPVDGTPGIVDAIHLVGGEGQDEPASEEQVVTLDVPPFVGTVDMLVGDGTQTEQLPPLIEKGPWLPESFYPADAKPLEVELKPPPDTWNQLLATLENLPGVTDMKPVWLKYAKQLTGLMIMAGLWKETDATDLTKLSKKALVEKVTEAHKQATKKAGDHAPF